MHDSPKPPFTLNDLSWEEPERLSLIDRVFEPRLRDRRDLVLMRAAVRRTAWALVGLSLFIPGVFRWWMAPLYLLGTLLQLGPYILMLHCMSHRKTFKDEHSAWENWAPMLLGPFYGQTPFSYLVHHLGMHHAEGNLLSDLSTTMPYRRDSFRHWLHYMARFALGSYALLPRYFQARGRDRMLNRWVKGELGWLAMVTLALWLNPAAALTVFVGTLVLFRTLAMSGNWAQHAFVDIDDPNNPFKNSTHLINHKYNVKCFNDGYHIVHHLRPALHWSEMPTWFEDRWEEFAAQDAIVFDGLGNNQTVWFSLMTGNYDRLAEHLVDWPGQERTHDEKVAFLKSRVQRQKGRIRGLFEAGPGPDEPDGTEVMPAAAK